MCAARYIKQENQNSLMRHCQRSSALRQVKRRDHGHPTGRN